MNQAKLRQLSLDRLADAEVLLAGQRWAFAYYVAGYAVECGLKSCVLSQMIHTGLVFEDKKPPDFRVHDLEALIGLAGLRAELGRAIQSNPTLGRFWGVVAGWRVESRYTQTAESDARAIVEAVTDQANGVMPWVQTYW